MSYIYNIIKMKCHAYPHSIIIAIFRTHLGADLLIVVLSLTEEDIMERLAVRHRDQEHIQSLLMVCLVLITALGMSL